VGYFFVIRSIPCFPFPRPFPPPKFGHRQIASFASWSLQSIPFPLFSLLRCVGSLSGVYAFFTPQTCITSSFFADCVVLCGSYFKGDLLPRQTLQTTFSALFSLRPPAVGSSFIFLIFRFGLPKAVLFLLIFHLSLRTALFFRFPCVMGFLRLEIFFLH